VGFPEEFGLAPGDVTTGQLVAALKAIGFDIVLDTNNAADLTIMEEGTELLHRIKARTEEDDTMTLENPKALEEPLPMFTSCCPGWMAFVEKSEPELASFISTCKSPHVSFY
jgi:iron only hydrogenase large subunit-like protein